MADSVIFIVASRTEWAHLLVDAVEVMAQIPVIICAEASQIYLVLSIFQLGFFLLGEVLVDLSNAGVFMFRSSGRILHVAVDHRDDASEESWAAEVRASLAALSGSSFPWMPQ